jgi:hypothetical protein
MKTLYRDLPLKLGKRTNCAQGVAPSDCALTICKGCNPV